VTAVFKATTIWEDDYEFIQPVIEGEALFSMHCAELHDFCARHQEDDMMHLRS